MFFHVVQDGFYGHLEVTIFVLEFSYEFWGDGFFEIEEDSLLEVAAVLVGVELLDVEFSELVYLLVGDIVFDGKESWVGDLWIVGDGGVGVQASILWFIGGLELSLTEKDPRPSSFGGAKENAG